MSNSLSLLRYKFPFSDLPSTAEKYYEHIRRDNWSAKRKVLESREKLIAALESDEEFAAFWKGYEETCPDSEDYLSSLLDATQPFDNSKITDKYETFLRWRKFSDISPVVKKRILSEFDAIRPSLYRAFLEKEALRLNCNVQDVRPTPPVLPLKGGAQPVLCSLPDYIFTKIMHRLETYEIFRLTLVCKSWRDLVYQNASTITKVEHSLTTHLLTFTKWMTPSNIVKGRDFRMHYQSFGWSLIEWCSNISPNLKTLVLHEFNCPYSEVVELSRRCPNLRHLQFKFTDIDKWSDMGLHLPELESLITEDSHFNSASKFVVPIFATSYNLRVFKGKLNTRDIISIDKQRLSQDAFSTLIALQIISFSHELLGALASVGMLQLRYLYLGDSFPLTRCRLCPYHGMIDEERNAFHSLLSNLNHLEVLVSLWDLDLDENTIKFMTKHNQRLKCALMWFHVTSLENEGFFESVDRRADYDDQVALVSFEEMLLEKDPSRDLSTFEFLVENARSKTFLQDAKTGFSIYEGSDLHLGLFDKWDLRHPTTRRQLGIDF